MDAVGLSDPAVIFGGAFFEDRVLRIVAFNVVRGGPRTFLTRGSGCRVVKDPGTFLDDPCVTEVPATTPAEVERVDLGVFSIELDCLLIGLLGVVAGDGVTE